MFYVRSFFSVVFIQIFCIKSTNPSFYVKYVENSYFPLLFKFKMKVSEAQFWSQHDAFHVFDK
jgi:hypothetical protein